ncbi:hypothetical protein [Pararhizobium sp.]|uniref:hypothetical protein n=1 Tax=Pararhizobium sp. TaxID=1977563 RepID=UPI00271CE0C1|nr:hypothetical protein [Pararhizobium sp.]MDO9417432.1 hypothetical protein [Pararhizobium sp.]
MKTFTISEARSAVQSGGVLSANLTPVGSMFALEFETRNGAAMLIASVSKEVRRFSNPIKAFEIIRDLGLEGGRFSVTGWRPNERVLDRATRPDKSAALRAAHKAADLKRTLESRIQEADSLNTVWQDHNEVFEELEKRYAD